MEFGAEGALCRESVVYGRRVMFSFGGEGTAFVVLDNVCFFGVFYINRRQLIGDFVYVLFRVD